jgi:LysM repeat protein
MEENRNPRPQQNGSSLPTLTLLVLMGVIGGMLYIGWEFLADKPGNTLTAAHSNPIVEQEKEEHTKDNSTESGAKVVDAQASPTKVTPEELGLPTKNHQSSEDLSNKKVSTEAKKDPKKETDHKEIKDIEEATMPKGGVKYTHVVDMGETFYGLANRYNIKWETLKKMNPQIKDETKDLKVGTTKLNLKVKAVHTVGQGDVLRIVAEKYGVSKELLMQANKKDKDFVTKGEKLIIPFSSKQ